MGCIFILHPGEEYILQLPQLVAVECIKLLLVFLGERENKIALKHSQDEMKSKKENCFSGHRP